MAELEIRKMKQGMSYSCKEKTIIMNVFKYFRLQNPEICVTEIVRRTANATGCSEKSIFQFRKEEASIEGFKVPKTTKIRKNMNINSRENKYDNNVRIGIKNIIYDLKYKGVTPSLKTILRQVNGNSELPNFSLMTLRRLLFDMGFGYEKHGNKAILVEKSLIKKDVKTKKSKKLKNERTDSTEQVNSMDSINKERQQISQTNLTMLPNHHINSTEQNHHHHRLLPMHHMHHHHQHDNNHMMSHMPHHNMSMMLNHRMPPSSHQLPTSNVNLSVTHSHSMPSNVNLNMRPDIPPWMHHTTQLPLMKRE